MLAIGSLSTMVLLTLGTVVVHTPVYNDSPVVEQLVVEGNPVGVFWVHVHGSEPLHFKQSGKLLDSGFMGYEGEHKAANGSWVARWKYEADLDPHGTASIRGSFSFMNTSLEKTRVDLRMALPISPVIGKQCVVGGRLAMKLQFDSDGGVLEVPASESGWATMVDDEVVSALHSGPLVMTGVADGIANMNSEFGVTTNGLAGPSVEDGFGVRHSFRISSGDMVTYASAIVLAGSEEDFLRRRETRTPIAIGTGEDRMKIDLSNSRGRSSRARKSAAGTGRNTLVVRPAHTRDHNIVEGNH